MSDHGAINTYSDGGMPNGPMQEAEGGEELKPRETTLGFNPKAPWRCIKPHCPLECDGCNHAIRNEPGARMLVLELLDAFAKDDLDSPFEDGDSAIVDEARAFLRIPEAARAASNPGEALDAARYRWLRDAWLNDIDAGEDVAWAPIMHSCSEDEMDADIDRAIARSLSAGGEA